MSYVWYDAPDDILGRYGSYKRADEAQAELTGEEGYCEECGAPISRLRHLICRDCEDQQTLDDAT